MTRVAYLHSCVTCQDKFGGDVFIVWYFKTTYSVSLLLLYKP